MRQSYCATRGLRATEAGPYRTVSEYRSPCVATRVLGEHIAGPDTPALQTDMTGPSSSLAGDRIIDFGNGQPSLSLLPLNALRVAADHCLRQGDASLLQYGADQGDETFRASLARFLSRRYAAPIDAEHLMASASASQALDLVCLRFTRPGDTIFVEEPTYFLALQLFRDHGLRVVGIPIDGEGIRHIVPHSKD